MMLKKDRLIQTSTISGRERLPQQVTRELLTRWMCTLIAAPLALGCQRAVPLGLQEGDVPAIVVFQSLGKFSSAARLRALRKTNLPRQ
jgi:hypothetical protein